DADIDRRRRRIGAVLRVDASAFGMAGVVVSSEADRSGDLHRGLSSAVGGGAPGLLHPGEARDKTRPDGNAPPRVRIENRRWKIENRRWKIENRTMIFDAIFDPRSSTLDVPQRVCAVCA